MTLQGDAKFKGKLTCSLKNNIKYLVRFHTSSRKSEHLHFDRAILSKAKRFRWKNTEELCFMTVKSNAKFEKN